MKSDFIWMDGQLVPFDQATVHFITPTLHYGLGVFEGIRCYATAKGPAVFRLQEHLERFLDRSTSWVSKISLTQWRTSGRLSI